MVVRPPTSIAAAAAAPVGGRLSRCAALACVAMLLALLLGADVAQGIFPSEKVASPAPIACQQLRMRNQTKILCQSRLSLNDLDKKRKKRSPTNQRVCEKIYKLAERLKSFEEGNFRYCDPARCLRESRHCRGGHMTTECNLCLGKCWLQYGYPVKDVAGKQQFRSYPCDPTSCGVDVFCGGFDMRSSSKNRVILTTGTPRRKE